MPPPSVFNNQLMTQFLPDALCIQISPAFGPHFHSNEHFVPLHKCKEGLSTPLKGLRENMGICGCCSPTQTPCSSSLFIHQTSEVCFFFFLLELNYVFKSFVLAVCLQLGLFHHVSSVLVNRIKIIYILKVI